MKEDGSKQAELTIRMRKKYSKGCLGNSRTMGQLPTNWLAMKVNIVKPIVNNARLKGDFCKSVSPFRKSLNKTTTLRTKFSYQKVNTTEVNAVSAVGGKRETAVKPSAASLNGDEKDQTVLGKDYSNLLIADSLLKTIWFINAPCYGNEALAIYSPKAFGILVSFCLWQSRMSNTSDKGTTFEDGAARVELYSIDVAATFGVPLTTMDDLQKLINDIDVGKHDELLSELTNEDHMETLEALGFICNSIKVNRNNADVIPCKVSYADYSIKSLMLMKSTIPSDPIVQSVDINKSTSYAGVAGGSAKDKPNVTSNFRTLVADPKFDGVNISIPRKVVENVSTRFEHTLYGYFIGKRMAFPVVEYYARNNWAKHGLKRIMMNSKCFFFFKFDSRAGLEAVLEGGPWLIRKSPIILKKWSRYYNLKEELTRIPIWVKLHDVTI
ncbi:zinc knuckle CX2CX4HX4C containing protein [Tanacetum coccineum]